MPDTIEPTGDDAMYAHITFENGAIGQWIDDHAGHGLRRDGRAGLRLARLASTVHGNRNGRPITAAPGRRHRRSTTSASWTTRPSYRLDPLAAELFGGERVWTYDFAFNETDARMIALEYHELGECIASR